MSSEPQIPVIIKPIPAITTNEGAACGPLDLKEFIQSPDKSSGDVRYYAQLSDEQPLPKGLICTTDGLLGGIAAAGTAGTYQIILIAENEAIEPLMVEMNLTINSRLTTEDPSFLGNLKTQIWEALGQNLPLPEMGDAMDRPITPTELYYLMQRYAVLSIWDVYNMDPAHDKVLLNLPDSSPHYNIYDRGSSLIGAPKDLFSYDRTLADAIQTSKVMAREVFKRGWTIEFAGFNKMVRAAWIELRLQGDKAGKHLEILHYSPGPEDIKVYTAEAARPTGPSI